jgi:hypothetical protein
MTNPDRQAGISVPGGCPSPRYALGNLVTFWLHDGRQFTKEISAVSLDGHEPQYCVVIEHDPMHSNCDTAYWVREQEIVSQEECPSPRYALGNLVTFRLHDGHRVTGEISTVNLDATQPQYHIRIEHDPMYSSGYWVWEQEIVSQGVQLPLFDFDLP